ncbi:MAG: hypothetical protein IIA82_10650 [Thaumarchaeota archaeon]|nr:hypothetical protein [Nitrososphaerota archaeon]
MAIICLSKWRGSSDLRFASIAKLTKIPGGTLQRILPRLEKRGWIKKTEKWINLPGLLHYNLKNKRVLEIDYQAMRKINNSKESEDEIPYEKRRRISRGVKNEFMPRKITVFEFREFPYLTRGKNMPLGTKRMWKRASKTVKAYAKQDKLKPLFIQDR